MSWKSPPWTGSAASPDLSKRVSGSLKGPVTGGVLPAMGAGVAAMTAGFIGGSKIIRKIK